MDSLPAELLLNIISNLECKSLAALYQTNRLFRAFCLDEPDRLGRTLLSYAARYWPNTTVQFFITAGADVNTRDYMGRTPLHFAAMDCDDSKMQTFLDAAGVKVNAVDCIGRTPLMYAAKQKQEKNVQLLLADSRVNIEAKDQEGWTALSHASHCGNVATILALVLIGQANINQRDDIGQSLIQLAKMREEKRNIEVLRQLQPEGILSTGSLTRHACCLWFVEVNSLPGLAVALM